MADTKTPAPTLRQIIQADGKAVQGTHTSPLWVSDEGVFSNPTGENTIMHFTTGEDYFNDLIKAIDAATSEVHIAGWQINWDALLQQGLRLYDLVYRNAKRGVKFYVMPWNDTKPVQTYEAQTVLVLHSINDRLKAEKIENAGAVIVMPADSQADKNANYYSHHQKQVIIDRKVGYIGGIDLAYGRFDDANYDLHAKAKGRRVLNSYNNGLPGVEVITAANTVHPDTKLSATDLKAIANGALQVPYMPVAASRDAGWKGTENNIANLHVLSDQQPRQPWQDVHSRMEGPVVAHLMRNFTLRWNTLGPKKKLEVPSAFVQNDIKKGTQIQVLRSAPANMRKAEYSALVSKKGITPPAKEEHDIQEAMKQLIGKSVRFIYIESQFFVSAFGAVANPTGALSPAGQFIKDGAGGIGDKSLWVVRSSDADSQKDMDRPPSNGVCFALITRIVKAILGKH
jgi:phospholipase D1/2